MTRSPGVPIVGSPAGLAHGQEMVVLIEDFQRIGGVIALTLYPAALGRRMIWDTGFRVRVKNSEGTDVMRDRRIENPKP